MKSINEVIVSITNKCNLKCRMCDIPDIELEELSSAQWQQIIDDAAQIGAHTVVFSGGEPLLRPDIFELISYTRKNNMNACLTSNGAEIDDFCAEKLAKAGVNVVNISIEGPQAEHDYLRGKGSYKKAIKALERLNKQNIETTLAATVSRYNYNKITHVIEIARQCHATTVRFQPFNNLFLKDKSKEADFFIDDFQVISLKEEFEQVTALAQESGISINPGAYLKQIPDYLSSGKPALNHGCQALWTSCPINARGDVFPCWILTDEQRQLGNLRIDRLINIWNSPKHEKIRGNIAAEKCEGCLMSCYDQAYAEGSALKDILTKMKKAGRKSVWIRQKNKAVKNMRGWFLALKKKYAFYAAYHGSLKKIFIRAKNAFLIRNKMKKEIPQTELEQLAQHIHNAKKTLKKEQLKYK